jgi:hypothetical protein
MNVIEGEKGEHATASSLEMEKLPERATAVKCRSVLLIQERMAKVEVAEVQMFYIQTGLGSREIKLVGNPHHA